MTHAVITLLIVVEICRPRSSVVKFEISENAIPGSETRWILHFILFSLGVGRWRHCSYHCLQLLAARALLFMAQGSAVQQQLAQEPQLRILAAALDSTHDPVSRGGKFKKNEE